MAAFGLGDWAERFQIKESDMAETKIQWCDHSINPIRARDRRTGAVGHYCEKVAAGCTNCYASTLQRRFKMPPFGSGQRRDDVELFLDESKLDEVRRRKKPTRYFWEDMSDLFGDWVEQDWINKCFAAMDATPQHTHILLTKRPERIRRMWPEVSAAVFNETFETVPDNHMGVDGGVNLLTYRPNCWLLTSIANQADADRNIPHLLKCRELAPVLGVSAEPLVGPIDLLRVREEGNAYDLDALSGIWSRDHGWDRELGPLGVEEEQGPASLDWCIVGGESGYVARPCNVEWLRSLVRQCKCANTPIFVKQLGAKSYNCIGSHDRAVSAGPGPSPDCRGNACDGQFDLKDAKGGDIDEFPEDLRVREFPQ